MRLRLAYGLLAFTLVVVFTILASQAFDTKLIWESHQDREAHDRR